jgi:pimeloyl-ACP methyl ester carboxylesterase
MSKTIYMIHGMWCTGSIWDDFKKPFEERGYECIALTLPYHDVDPDEEPDPRLGTTSVLDYAGFVEARIRELNEEPIIIGHSMGGLLAQILAARVRAKAVVLLTPVSPWGIWCLYPSVIFSFLTVFLKWGFWRKPQRLSFFKARYSGLNRVPRDDQRRIHSELVRESGRAAAEIGLWFAFPGRPTAVDASKIQCPMLVVGTSHDRLTPAAIVRKTALKYGRTSFYREYPRLGHWLFYEPGGNIVAEETAQWLDDYAR